MPRPPMLLFPGFFLAAGLAATAAETRGNKDSPVSVIENQPVWKMQQVVANAVIVPPSTYIVKAGETLRGVGNRSGAGSESIARANALKYPYLIREGQKLLIPGGRYHRVSEGETGIAIAAAYGVAWSRIVDINALPEPYILRNGQRLLLPDDAARKPSTMEARAAAFRIDIDDVLTGGQPASGQSGRPAASSQPRALPSNVPITEPAQFTGGFAWPAHGALLSRFGPGTAGARNNGIDIAIPAGTPIRVAANGVVAYAGDKVAVFGGLMLVNHGDGWVSAYGHASRVDVVRGQKVRKGQIIGLSGDSGYASRPKLHFELRKDRTPVNPLDHLPREQR